MAPPRRHHSITGSSGCHLEVGLHQSSVDVVPVGLTRCCIPTGDCLRAQQQLPSPNNNDPMLIALDDLRDTVRVSCNNDTCPGGRFMHRECFDQWEQTVLGYLKTCGRARSWSERQRHQNLWTKKGYDLAYKACGCRCGRGHLKKDLDWTPPPPTSHIVGRLEDIGEKTLVPASNMLGAKKKKRRNRHGGGGRQVQAQAQPGPGGQLLGADGRPRAGSLSSSSNGSSSPPVTGSETSVSPVHAQSRKKTKIDIPDRVR